MKHRDLRTYRRHAAPAAALLVGLLAAPSVATASDSQWTKIEHDCLTLFKHPKKAPEKKLEACADTWAAHSRRQFTSSTEEDTVKKAMRYLYESGSDVGSSIARGALFRLGVKLGVRSARKVGAAVVATPVSTRRRYNPPEATRADKKSAEKLAKAGVKDLVKKRYKSGTKKLQSAVEKDPRSEFALYNLACGYALQSQMSHSVEELQKLADLGTDQALERLIRARRDGDFAKIRDSQRFKAVTGYMKIQVINTIGDPGEKAIENIETMLNKLGHDRPTVGENEDKRDSPQILFKEHAKAQVPLIAELLNHPRVRLDPMKGKSDYDMVIKWGAKVIKDGGSTKVESFGPSTVDDKIASARRKQNKVLAKPEKAISKVDNVISTPDRAYRGVEGMGKRVEGTYKKAEGSFKKVKDLGGKISSL